MGNELKALDPGEGEALWAAGSLMVVKATTADTQGGVTVIEQECPAGLDSPEHVHDSEEQCLYMLAGSIELMCGGATRSLTAGCFAVMPRGVPHSFVVGPDGAGFLSLTTPAGFETFAREVGTPAAERPVPPDPTASLRLAAERVEGSTAARASERRSTS
jgi:quercetin dioxygenase-like cupin family protein